MDVVQRLTACDLFAVPVLIADSSDTEGFFPQKAIVLTDVCLPKPAGQLALQINVSTFTAELGYPIALDLDLVLQGALDGVDSSGRPVVLWTINQLIGRDIDGVTIDSVTGTLRTVVSEISPARRSVSCGKQRTFVVRLESRGTQADVFTIKMHGSLLGIPASTVLTINNIAMVGAAGLALSLAVEIRAQGSSRCPPSLFIEGRERVFQAWCTGVPPGLTPGYTWNVTGAQSIGSTNKWQLQLMLPSPAHTTTLRVEVSVAGTTAVDEVTFIPHALSEAVQLEELLLLICQLRRDVIRSVLLNPLGDPLRDVRYQPVTTSEFAQLASSAAGVAELATRISRMADSFPSQRA